MARVRMIAVDHSLALGVHGPCLVWFWLVKSDTFDR